MGTISEKLTYLNNTKSLLKTVINYADAGIDNNTTFRNYAVKLYDAYVDILKGDYSLIEGMPKGTATGTNISITNAEELPVYELKATKESTQDGTPTPSNPIEVKTVKGYRNLFDKDNANILNCYVKSGAIIEASNRKMIYINCSPNNSYTIKKALGTTGQIYQVGTTNVIPASNVNVIDYDNSTANETKTINTSANANYLFCTYYYSNGDLTEQQILDSIQIVEGNQELSYVPYGSNYLLVNVSDGTNTNQIPIPLNNNELVGIGTYLDELIVDKTGHVYLNKLIGKTILNGSETGYGATNTQPSNTDYHSYYYNGLTEKKRFNGSILMNYFKKLGVASIVSNIEEEGFWYNGSSSALQIGFISKKNTYSDFKAWLSTHNTIVYYALETSNLIDLNTTVDVELFKGANTITNSEGATMNIQYVKDINDLIQ